MNGNYVSLLAAQGSANYVSLISSKNSGGETAGSVARAISSLAGKVAYLGGETAGSVACGGSCSGGSSSGSFSAIA